LVPILKNIGVGNTVGTLADEFFDFAGKWSRIKYISIIPISKRLTKEKLL